MSGSVVTSSNRIALRTVEREDAVFLQRAYTKPELRDPLGRKPKSISQVEREIEAESRSGDSEHFVVCLGGHQSEGGGNEEPTPIGLFTARNVRQRPNIALWLDEEFHGEGYGKEAASLAIETIFACYDVPSIGAGVYEFNHASVSVLESLGFTQEGRQRKYKFYDGRYYDNLKYGILREEWRCRDNG